MAAEGEVPLTEWIIQTARLRLRRLRPEDLTDIRRMPWLDAERVLRRSLEDYASVGHAFWAVILRDSGEFAGVCGLLDQEIEGRREPEVAYHLIEDYHGRGLATEAARGVMDHAFGDLGLGRIVSFIEPGNQASARVAEKNGLVFERDALFRDIPARIFSAASPIRRSANSEAVRDSRGPSPGLEP
ncbi:MAG: GNAT family N-acetyltransferase [Gammaproteobacteria bacterium]|jgi:RimJ/RimL family protein N-acetyltransferase